VCCVPGRSNMAQPRFGAHHPPARHLTQEKIHAHNFGIPWKGFDIGLRMPAPFSPAFSGLV